MSFSAGNNQTILQQAQALGQRPQWSPPYGLTFGGWEQVQRYFMRSDTPNGMSTDNIPPEAWQALTNAIRAGQVVPGNDARRHDRRVLRGACRTGRCPPTASPGSTALPAGCPPTGGTRSPPRINARVNEANTSGYLDGVPTLEREKRHGPDQVPDHPGRDGADVGRVRNLRRSRELDRLELERQDAVRTGDLNRAQELAIHLDDLQKQYAEPQQQHGPVAHRVHRPGVRPRSGAAGRAR